MPSSNFWRNEILVDSGGLAIMLRKMTPVDHVSTSSRA
jgi:hypothetical protein